MKHPTTGKLLYDPSVVERYKDAVFCTCTTWQDVHRYCEKYILDFSLNNSSRKISDKEKQKIRNKIEFLLVRRKIATEKTTNKGKYFYLPAESERQVVQIYRNLQQILNQDLTMLCASESARRIGISHGQLNRMLSKYGEKVVLTEKKPIKNMPYYVEVEKKVSLEPRVPYILFVDGSMKYILSSVVETLRECVQEAKHEARLQRFNPFDGYWSGRLADQIRIKLRQNIYSK